MTAFCSPIPQRWIIILMCFFGLFNAYSMRVCLSIAITQMVLPVNNTVEFIDDTCPENNNGTQYKSNTTLGSGIFDWSEYTQGIILSSFYWGYLLTNLPGGMIAEKFGGKHTLGLGILSTALLTILTPLSIYFGDSTALICIRVLMGFGEGTTYPAITVLMAQWIPEEERSKAAAYAYSGTTLGTIFGMAVSGLILQYSEMGWPAVFYFFGGMGILSFLLNAILCFNKPTEHPKISDEELSYLKDKIKDTHSKLPSTPWKHILKSRPVWALVVATVGNAWGFLTIASDMPKYMSSVLKYSVQSNGYLSSLPYLCMWISSCTVSWFADSLIATKRMTTGQVRKLGCSVASFGPGIFLVAASYAGCDGSLVVTLLTIGMTLMGCATFSILINAVDLGPNYAGSLMGLVNGISTLSGIISPYIVGVITPNQTISEWRTVFFIVCAFFIISDLIFVFYGSGRIQEWNDPKFLEKKKDSNVEVEKEAIKLMTIHED